MSDFKIDDRGTLDVSGIDCDCYLEHARVHGPSRWTPVDLPALEASLCAECRGEDDVVVLLDEEG